MDTTWAYIAGIFDGEGSIGYYSDGQRRVSISQSGDEGKELLNFIKDKTGFGYIYFNIKFKPSQTIKNVRPMHVWNASKRQEMRKFLNSVLPYLIIKREKAKEVLEKLGENNIQTRWEKKEDELIQKLYKEKSFRDIAEILKRSHKSVRTRAIFLNLHKGQGIKSESGIQRWKESWRKKSIDDLLH